MTTFTITTHSGPDGQGRQRFTIEWPCEPTTFLHHGREITVSRRAQEQHARVPETVARLQTLLQRFRRLGRLPPAGLVVVDEAHHAVAAKSYGAILAHYQRASILGMTATPERLDGRGLDCQFDEMVEAPGPTEMVRLGALVTGPVWSVSHEQAGMLVRNVRRACGDYVRRDLSKRVNTTKLVGDVVDHYLRLAGDRATVCFAVDLEHAESLGDRFGAAGVRAAVVSGRTPTKEREALLAALKSGELKVLVNCDLLIEGWDLACVKCVIMARPTMSLARYRQMCGRAMRPYGLAEPLFIDHAGNALAFGFPHEEREWSLAAQPRSRAVGRAPLRRCDCGFLSQTSALQCDGCGAVFPVVGNEEAAGTLVVRHPLARRAETRLLARRRRSLAFAATLRTAVATGRRLHSERIGHATGAVLRAKKQAGYRAGNVPFGFAADADGKLAPHEGEQAVVATVLELRAAGMSLREIEAEAPKLGLVGRTGVPLKITQIGRITRAHGKETS